MTKDVLSIPLSEIEIGPRLREIDPDWAALIAETMKDRGQDTPIRVRPRAENGKFRLVAGAHRAEAARLAGWDAIEAMVFDGTDDQAKLLEIDENLMRRELSELDRATFLAQRNAIWLRLNPERASQRNLRRGPSDKLVARENLPLEDRFPVATAKKLGVSTRSIERAIARFNGINEAVRRRLANHPVAANGAQLDLLLRFTPEQQARVADELLADQMPARTVREAALRLGILKAETQAPADRDFQRLLAAWGPAMPEAQRRFLRQLVAMAGPDIIRTLRAELARYQTGAAGAEEGLAA